MNTLIKVLDLHIPGRIEQQQRVYSTKGLSPTLNAAMGKGGGCSPKYIKISKEMDKEKTLVVTADNGKQYAIQIRTYTPRDCYRLMGVHDEDIDKLLAKPIICKSKHLALAGNSIVANCLTAIFEELFYPSGNSYHDKHGQLSMF